jgi:hypothetical protein
VTPGDPLKTYGRTIIYIAVVVTLSLSIEVVRVLYG